MPNTTLTPKQAQKRYMGRMLGASGAYIGTVLAASFVVDEGDAVTVSTILVALVPAICILFMLRAVWMYLNEVDEVARHDFTQAMMVSLFIILAIGGGWGLVELFNDNLPRLPIFYVFPAFFGIYGLVSCFGFGRRA